MALSRDQRLSLWRDLKEIGEKTREFNYIPQRYLEDLANSDPAELCWRYVFNREQQDGFTRLWQEGRLDLSVENVVWRRRSLFSASPEIVREAERKVAGAEFDVRTQKQRPGQ